MRRLNKLTGWKWAARLKRCPVTIFLLLRFKLVFTPETYGICPSALAQCCHRPALGLACGCSAAPAAALLCSFFLFVLLRACTSLKWTDLDWASAHPLYRHLKALIPITTATPVARAWPLWSCLLLFLAVIVAASQTVTAAAAPFRLPLQEPQLPLPLKGGNLLGSICTQSCTSTRQLHYIALGHV